MLNSKYLEFRIRNLFSFFTEESEGSIDIDHLSINANVHTFSAFASSTKYFIFSNFFLNIVLNLLFLGHMHPFLKGMPNETKNAFFSVKFDGNSFIFE